MHHKLNNANRCSRFWFPNLPSSERIEFGSRSIQHTAFDSNRGPNDVPKCNSQKTNFWVQRISKAKRFTTHPKNFFVDIHRNPSKAKSGVILRNPAKSVKIPRNPSTSGKVCPKPYVFSESSEDFVGRLFACLPLVNVARSGFSARSHPILPKPSKSKWISWPKAFPKLQLRIRDRSASSVFRLKACQACRCWFPHLLR